MLLSLPAVAYLFGCSQANSIACMLVKISFLQAKWWCTSTIMYATHIQCLGGSQVTADVAAPRSVSPCVPWSQTSITLRQLRWHNEGDTCLTSWPMLHKCQSNVKGYRPYSYIKMSQSSQPIWCCSCRNCRRRSNRARELRKRWVWGESVVRLG